MLGGQRIAPMTLIRSDSSKNVTKIIPGEMYLFAYDPKLKDTLPYWDMYPLVFPFRRLPDGFIGLNMHYLPYMLRARILDRLMSYATNKTMDQTTRLKFSWATIQSASKLQLAESCVHRYLLSNVKSPFKRIESAHWATALMLPVEKFVGSSKQRVWTESLR